jgi:hypothetical protein
VAVGVDRTGGTTVAKPAGFVRIGPRGTTVLTPVVCADPAAGVTVVVVAAGVDRGAGTTVATPAGFERTDPWGATVRKPVACTELVEGVTVAAVAAGFDCASGATVATPAGAALETWGTGIFVLAVSGDLACGVIPGTATGVVATVPMR